MRSRFQLIQPLVFALWATSAYAAARESFGSSLASIPPMAIAMTLLISSLSGLASLLAQLKKDYQLQGEVPRLGLYVASKLTGSNVVGLAAFFYCEYKQWDPFLEALSIMGASYAGTMLAERAIAVYIDAKFPVKQGEAK
jgi:hypothetical protein